MRPAFEYGDEVRLIRNVRNDGTYPGMEMGELLIRKGTVGCVYDVGTYLQDQLIYKVHFLDQGRTVGCRQEELILASDPWVPSLFEFRDYVKSKIRLSVKGEVVVDIGQEGQIEKVLRDLPDGVQYHVHFGGGKIFQVPETVLEAAPRTAKKAAKAAGHGKGGEDDYDG